LGPLSRKPFDISVTLAKSQQSTFAAAAWAVRNLNSLINERPRITAVYPLCATVFLPPTDLAWHGHCVWFEFQRWGTMKATCPYSVNLVC
ncbi:hypothetical protein BaRGS_00007435, partial [Batillaria attramentaria]